MVRLDRLLALRRDGIEDARDEILIYCSLMIVYRLYSVITNPPYCPRNLADPELSSCDGSHRRVRCVVRLDCFVPGTVERSRTRATSS